jgi:hypothetical protein
MKKRNLTNSKKIAGYVSAASAVLATHNVNGQIGHQVLNPAVIVTENAPRSVDINGDQVPDFAFLIDSSVEPVDDYTTNTTKIALFIGAMTPAQDGAGAIGGEYLASALNCGINISSSSEVSSGILAYSTNQYNSYTYQSSIIASGGDFLGQNNKYMGIKVVLSTAATTHYGWVKISVPAESNTITIHELAINLTPDQAIEACQTVINDNANISNISIEDKVTILSNLNQATINVTPDIIGGKIELISLTGQIVKTQMLSDVDTLIQFDGITEGIYTLSVKSKAGNLNKRIYIK